MKVFICWLISILTDWVGMTVIALLLFAPNVVVLLKDLHTNGYYAIGFSAIVAIVPAFVTAIYAAINYEIILSWGVIRWMSPLNILTGRMSHFFKTLFMSGAAWAIIIFLLLCWLFPNAHFEWFFTSLKGLFGNLILELRKST